MVTAELQNWRDSSQNLTAAIRNYLDSSLALENIVAKQYETFSQLTDSDRDKLFDAVSAEQAVIKSRISQLDRANNSVNKLHNLSTKLVPIRTLPDELLVRIFALTCHACTFFSFELLSNNVRRCYQPLFLVTKVCADWRRIAISTPSLWNHIDILSDHIADKRYRLVDLWLERARKASLSLRIFFQEVASNIEIAGTLDWLVPHLGSAASLALRSEDESNRLHSTVQLWLKNGSPGSVKDLSVYGRGSFASQDSIWSLDEALEGIDAELVDSFLAPIRVLRLRMVFFTWTSTVYHGLVYLELAHIAHANAPTLRQFRDMLLASPDLRVLTLDYFYIKNPNGEEVSLTPVRLKSLQTLNVWSLLVDPHPTVFSILQSDSKELNVSINGRCLYSPAFESFNVTRLSLFVTLSNSSPHVMTQIPSFDNLEALLIRIGFGIDRYTCKTILEDLLALSRRDSADRSPRWPKLRTLWLFGGVYDIDAIKSVVEAYNIRTLILTNLMNPAYSGDPRSVLQPIVAELIVENRLSDSSLSEWQLRLR